MRLEAQSAVIEAGQVLLPEKAPWLDDFQAEIGQSAHIYCGLQRYFVFLCVSINHAVACRFQERMGFQKLALLAFFFFVFHYLLYSGYLMICLVLFPIVSRVACC